MANALGYKGFLPKKKINRKFSHNAAAIKIMF